jgi:hypothetical protein
MAYPEFGIPSHAKTLPLSTRQTLWHGVEYNSRACVLGEFHEYYGYQS